MLRTILGAVAGVVAWIAVVIGISFLLRAVAPGIGTALNMHATAAAMAGRLAISFLGSLLGGYLAARIGAARAALAFGVLMLILFVPYHLLGSDPQGPIWTSFPLWYHLSFFVSLPLLAYLGGRLAGR